MATQRPMLKFSSPSEDYDWPASCVCRSPSLQSLGWATWQVSSQPRTVSPTQSWLHSPGRLRSYSWHDRAGWAQRRWTTHDPKAREALRPPLWPCGLVSWPGFVQSEFSDLDHLGSSWLQATIWDCFHPMSRKYLIALLSVSKKKYFVGGPEEARTGIAGLRLQSDFESLPPAKRFFEGLPHWPPRHRPAILLRRPVASPLQWDGCSE